MSTATATQAIEHFKQVAQRNVEFVFYVSGRGLQMLWATTGRTLPMLYDSNARDAQAQDFNRLATLIGAIPARQIAMLIDTCHAGAAAASLDTAVIFIGRCSCGKTGRSTGASGDDSSNQGNRR
jgi:hypothetical protein